MFRRRDETQTADIELREALKWSFRDACVGAGVSRAVDSPIAGTSVRTPRVTNVQLALSPVRLTVQLIPGMGPEELARAGRLIAPHLGGIALRVTDRGHGWVLVDILTTDPLAGSHTTIPWVSGIYLGRDEHGQDVTVPELPHTLVVGSTGAGKSTQVYSLITQSLMKPHTRVCGIDPSNTTLRGFPREDAVCGLGDPEAIEGFLTDLVAELDRRMSALPADSDLLPISDEYPRTLIVLEEYVSLIRALEIADKKLCTRVRGLIARILLEGRKVRMSVLTVAQRPDANYLGGLERAQHGLRIAFRLDTAEGLKMTIPEAVDQAAEHAAAPAGVALVAMPGRPLTRLQAPYVSYADYVRRAS